MRIPLLFLLASALFFSACKSGPTTVLIETEMGNMTIELYDDTPLHKENFIKLVEQGYYDGLGFHRIIRGFMIQGGDPFSKDPAKIDSVGMGGPGYNIPAEIKHVHVKGALAAARLGDGVNPQRESSGSQFYIVQGGPVEEANFQAFEQKANIKYTPEQKAKYLKDGGVPQLDGDYTIFGQVVEGLDVIDKIAAVPVDGVMNRPTQKVSMKIKVLNK